jgi:hypothetical protein
MARFSPMVDMANTPEEVTAELAKDAAMPSVPAASKPSVPTYDYGLCLRLNEESLEKLQIDGDLPAVGDMIHFVAMAKVTSASVSEREGTNGGKETCRSVELTVTHIGMLEDEDHEARDWYKGTMGGGDKSAAGEAED